MHPLKKIGIFADVQNIYYTCREIHGRHFDYRKLLKRVARNGEVAIARAYTSDRDDDQQRKFQDALRHMGFTVLLKPYIQRADGSAKCDWDVGITIDILEAAPDLDIVVLLSGDGDFDMLMRKIRDKHKVRTEAYGVSEVTANALIDSVSLFHRIGKDLLV